MDAGSVRYRPLMALTRFVRSRPDLLFALGLTVVGQVEIWTREIDGEHAAYAALALPITLALAWRVQAPLAVLAVIAGTFFPSALLFPLSGDAAFAVVAALLIALYSVGAHTGGWQAVAVSSRCSRSCSASSPPTRRERTRAATSSSSS